MAPDPKSFQLSHQIHHYLVEHGTPPDDIERALIGETEALGRLAGMQIAPEQSAFMSMLVRISGAREALEVGTFTGYSSLSVAKALPPDGHLLCLDVNEEWTAIARRYWKRAGVEDKIELRLGPAVDTLRELPDDRTFDFVFVDADKASYVVYYEEILPHLRPGGLLLADNVLWGGRVVEPTASDDDTLAVRAFNEHVRDDDRVDQVMLPLGDGLTLARKR